MSDATPRPWRMAEFGRIVDQAGEDILVKGFALSGCKTALANQALIVEAVNARATIDSIRAEIEGEREVQRRKRQLFISSDNHRLMFQHGEEMLSRALAIIDRHMKEKA